VTVRIAGALCATALATFAATSTAWETSGFNDFLKGHLSGLSLTSDGILQPGPSLRFRAPLNQPALWSVAAGPDGSIYAATGHTGKLFRIAADGAVSTVWTSDQPEIFALAATSRGQLYAATSPNGGVYEIGTRPRQIWRCPAKYIWAIQPSPDGSLYIATGEPGRIYRISSTGQADLYYDTGQPNVTALTLGPNGHLYAGTDPNGLIYEIQAPNSGTILYDSTLPEIRALALDSSGNLYAAAMGGAVATRSTPASASASSSAAPAVASSPTVITVTAAQENRVGADTDPSTAKSPPEQSRVTASSTSASPATSTTAVVEVSGVEKSAIYRIRPDRTVETLRSSKEDNVYDLLLDGDSVLFATDEHCRIYRLNGRKTTLLAEAGDGEATRLSKSGSALYAALSNPARVLAFGGRGAQPGSYESQVHDSTSVARWGHLQWHGTGAGLAFRTRTGNAARPDSTWSDWSAPLTDSSGSLIASPPARFVQWRAEWPAGSDAQIDSVDVPYLPQNAPPVIHSLTVTSVSNQTSSKAPPAATNSSGAYSITVTDTGEAPAASSTTSTTQTVSRLQTPQTQLSWQADDPDGDKLVYSVYFRAEDETEWQLIRSRMFENTLLLDPDVFADGRYFFRVVASDAPSNAAEYAQETEFVSTPVLIDNTPPVVTLGPPHRNGASLDIDIDAHDTTSPLRLCEYSLDAGLWQPIEAVDGITDSPRERFHLHLDRLRPGEHLLAFRVYDSANNAGLAKVILR
jgi:hypothetical protein